MEQFSLNKYLADPTRKVVTRYGKPVRIICTDRKCVYPIVYLVRETKDEVESVFTSTDKGKCNYNREAYDLFFAPKKQSRWIFLQSGKCPDGSPWEHPSSLYRLQESAIKDMGKYGGFALTEITWEE